MRVRVLFVHCLLLFHVLLHSINLAGSNISFFNKYRLSFLNNNAQKAIFRSFSIECFTAVFLSVFVELIYIIFSELMLLSVL